MWHPEQYSGTGVSGGDLLLYICVHVLLAVSETLYDVTCWKLYFVTDYLSFTCIEYCNTNDKWEQKIFYLSLAEFSGINTLILGQRKLVSLPVIGYSKIILMFYVFLFSFYFYFFYITSKYQK